MSASGSAYYYPGNLPDCPSWCEVEHAGPVSPTHATRSTHYSTETGGLAIRLEQRPEDLSPQVIIAESPRGTTTWRLRSSDEAEDLADNAAALGLRAFATIIREAARYLDTRTERHSSQRVRGQRPPDHQAGHPAPSTSPTVRPPTKTATDRRRKRGPGR